MKNAQYGRFLSTKRGMLIQENLARQRMLKGAERNVYSTQEACLSSTREDKNKGCIPCSIGVSVSHSFTEYAGSGRTSFSHIAGETFSLQKIRCRVMNAK